MANASEAAEKFSVKYHRTYSHAWNLVQAALDLNDGSDHTEEWSVFRSALINEENFNDLWKDEDFKRAIHYLNDIVDATIQINYNDSDRENNNLCVDLAEQFISECGLGDDSDFKSVRHLLEVVNVLEKRVYYHALCIEALHSIRMTFTTIVQAQQMVIDAAKEEKAVSLT